MYIHVLLVSTCKHVPHSRHCTVSWKYASWEEIWQPNALALGELLGEVFVELTTMDSAPSPLGQSYNTIPHPHHQEMKVNEESEKAGLKLNIQKTKITASSPITSQQIDGEKVETVTDFIFLGSKITMDSDCSHEIKRCLFLGRKAMTNLDRVFKSRDITFPEKTCIVKAMVFPVIMYGCESWIITKADCQRTDAFELWCWRRLLKIPWTARRSNPSILKEINPEYLGRTDAEAEAPIPWPPDVKSWLTGKGPDITGRDWRQEEKGMTWLDGITQWRWVWAESGSWWWTRRPGVLWYMGSRRVRHDWATELNFLVTYLPGLGDRLTLAW